MYYSRYPQIPSLGGRVLEGSTSGRFPESSHGDQKRESRGLDEVSRMFPALCHCSGYVCSHCAEQ